MKLWLLLVTIGLGVSVSGCVHALRPYNAPSEQKLHVQTAAPTNCFVRVADSEDYRVANDGRATFEVPRLPRGCDVYLFGLMKIRDGNPENVRAIWVFQDGKCVRKLSLTQLDKLPVDAEGYHTLVLK